MLKQTIYLFTKALIIGVLLNVGIQQVSDGPAQAAAVQEKAQSGVIMLAPR